MKNMYGRDGTFASLILLVIGALFLFGIIGSTIAHADSTSTSNPIECAIIGSLGLGGLPIPNLNIGCTPPATSNATSSTPATPDINAAINSAIHDAIASSTTLDIQNGSTTVTGTIDPTTGLNVQVGTPYGDISLTQPACHVVVKKIVVGGTAVSGDFMISVTQNSSQIAGSPQAGSEAGNFYNTLQPGIYHVSESGGPSGYTASFSGDCNAQGDINLQPNGNAICTITNTFATSTNPGGGGTGTSTPPGGGDTGTSTPPTTGGGGPGPTGGGGPGPTGGGGPGPTGGVSPSTGGNGPIVDSGPGGNGPIATGGGSTPPGQVLGNTIDLPAVPNTGVGDLLMTQLILLFSGVIALAGLALLRTIRA